MNVLQKHCNSNLINITTSIYFVEQWVKTRILVLFMFHQPYSIRINSCEHTNVIKLSSIFLFNLQFRGNFVNIFLRHSSLPIIMLWGLQCICLPIVDLQYSTASPVRINVEIIRPVMKPSIAIMKYEACKVAQPSH